MKEKDWFVTFTIRYIDGKLELHDGSTPEASGWVVRARTIDGALRKAHEKADELKRRSLEVSMVIIWNISTRDYDLL